MKKLLIAAALSLSFSALASTQTATHEFTVKPELANTVIVVKNPDVVADRVTDSATEVFMELDNTGKYAHRLVAATSPAAESVELHDTYFKNGRTFMHQVPSITIKPHSDEDLKNGALHIMLINTSKPLLSGQVVPVTLIFGDGSWIKINATVR